MQNNHIGSRDALSAIAQLLLRNKLQVLNLQKNNIDCDGVVLLAEALRSNTSLETLNLKSNQIMDKGGAALGEILNYNTTLKDLDLSNNKYVFQLILTLRIGNNGGVPIANGIRENTTMIRISLRSNNVKDQAAIAFAKSFSLNKNNVQELYLGYNGITIEGAKALSDMLKRNTKLKKFDMQGILLDINGVRHVADSIRHNRSLLHFKIDIDGENGSTAAKTLSEALQSNQTIQDLVIGGETELGQEMTSRISESLNYNKSMANGDEIQPLRLGLSNIGDRSSNRASPSSFRGRTFDEGPPNENYKPKLSGYHDSDSQGRRSPSGSVRGKEIDYVITDLKDQLESTKQNYSKEISKLREMERTTQFELNLNKKTVEDQQSKVYNLEKKLKQEENRWNDLSEELEKERRRTRELELRLSQEHEIERKEKLNQSLGLQNVNEEVRRLSYEVKSVEEKVIEQVHSKLDETVRTIFSQLLPTTQSTQSRERPQSAYAKSNSGYISDSELKEYASITRDLRHLYNASPVEEEQQSVLKQVAEQDGKIQQKIQSISTEFRSEIDQVKKELYSIASPNSIPTSIAVDQIKMETDLKISKSTREVEDRINIKLVEMENRHNLAISALRKHVDDSLEIQRNIITKMTEEQRWMEEEGIRLRVEHEARMHNELRALEERLNARRDESLVKTNRIEVQLRKLTENLHYGTRIDDEEPVTSVNTSRREERRIPTPTVNTSFRSSDQLGNTLHQMLSRASAGYEKARSPTYR